jgi:hypothetical protein
MNAALGDELDALFAASDTPPEDDDESAI